MVSLRARNWNEAKHPRDDRGRFARKGGARWASKVLKGFEARFGDTSMAQGQDPRERGRLQTGAGGLLDIAGMGKAARERFPKAPTVAKGTFERGPSSASSSNAGVTGPTTKRAFAIKIGDRFMHNGAEVEAVGVPRAGRKAGQAVTVVKVRRISDDKIGPITIPGESVRMAGPSERQDFVEVPLGRSPGDEPFRGVAGGAAARMEALRERAGLGRTPGGVDMSRVPVKAGGVTTSEARRQAVIDMGTSFSGNPYLKLPKLEALTDDDFAALTPDQQDNVRFLIHKLTQRAPGEDQRRAVALQERFGKWGNTANLAKANAARREMRAADLKASTDPKDNGAKIKALQDGTLTSASLYRKVSAGPSGQRADVRMGTVRHTPDNPSGEFRISDNDGNLRGWATRTVRNGESVYSVHSENYDGEHRLEGWAGELSTAADVLINGEIGARSSLNSDSRRISPGSFERYAGRNMPLDELELGAARDELRKVRAQLDNPNLGPSIRAAHERRAATIEADIADMTSAKRETEKPKPPEEAPKAAPAQKAAKPKIYEWSSVREAPASSLEVGDQFIKPTTGSAFTSRGDGEVEGHGFQPLEGVKFTVTAREGNTITARDDSGRELTQTIPGDRKVNVLRIGTEGPKARADRKITEAQREADRKTAERRAASLATRDGVPPADGRPDITAVAAGNSKGRYHRWDLASSKGRDRTMAPDVARAYGGKIDDQPAAAEVLNPVDGKGDYRYRIFNENTGATIEEGTSPDAAEAFRFADRIFDEHGTGGMARSKGAGPVRFEARQTERPKDASRGDFGKGPFYDNKVYQINPDGSEREVSSHLRMSDAERAAADRNNQEIINRNRAPEAGPGFDSAGLDERQIAGLMTIDPERRAEVAAQFRLQNQGRAEQAARDAAELAAINAVGMPARGETPEAQRAKLLQLAGKLEGGDTSSLGNEHTAEVPGRGMEYSAYIRGRNGDRILNYSAHTGFGLPNGGRLADNEVPYYIAAYNKNPGWDPQALRNKAREAMRGAGVEPAEFRRMPTDTRSEREKVDQELRDLKDLQQLGMRRGSVDPKREARIRQLNTRLEEMRVEERKASAKRFKKGDKITSRAGESEIVSINKEGYLRAQLPDGRRIWVDPADAEPVAKVEAPTTGTFNSSQVVAGAKTAPLGTVLATGERAASGHKYRMVAAEHRSGLRYVAQQTFDTISNTWDETGRHFNTEDLDATLKTQAGVGVTWSSGGGAGADFLAETKAALADSDPRRDGSWNLPEKPPPGAKIPLTRNGTIKAPRSGRTPGGSPTTTPETPTTLPQTESTPAYDKLLSTDGPAAMQNKTMRGVVEQMEAHGWQLKGENPMMQMTTWEAPDGRTLAVMGINTKKPTIWSSEHPNASGTRELNFKATMAHVITPTFRQAPAPSISAAMEKLGMPSLSGKSWSDPGLASRDRSYKPLEDVQRAMMSRSLGYSGAQDMSPAEAAAKLRATATQNRATAEQRIAYDSGISGGGRYVTPQAQLLLDRADQFDRVADELERMDATHKASVAERERLAALPPDIRPGRSALAPKPAGRAPGGRAPRQDPGEVAGKLRAINTRQEANEALKDLTLAELKAVHDAWLASQPETPFNRGKLAAKTKAEAVEKLVELTVGARINSEAIRRGVQRGAEGRVPGGSASAGRQVAAKDLPAGHGLFEVDRDSADEPKFELRDTEGRVVMTVRGNVSYYVDRKVPGQRIVASRTERQGFHAQLSRDVAERFNIPFRGRSSGTVATRKEAIDQLLRMLEREGYSGKA